MAIWHQNSITLSIVRRQCLVIVLMVAFLAICNVHYGQRRGTKPTRAAPPKFNDELSGVFYSDLSKQLAGVPPRIGDVNRPVVAQSNAEANPDDSDESVWPKLISADSIEDLVKSSALRIEKYVTTPVKFAGGSYNDARQEFALLSVLFGVIELYNDDVRWRNQSTDARQLFVKANKNARKGDQVAFTSAKARKTELADLLRGSTISSGEPNSKNIWNETIERDTVMQLLEWALREKLQPALSTESDFPKEHDRVRRYAELLKALGEVSADSTMPDGDDEDYVDFCRAMITTADKLVESVELNQWSAAREAYSAIDQSCSNCHDSYR